MKYSSNRRSKASVISAYERREYSGRQIGWRRVLWYLVLIFCTAVTMWSMYGSRFLLRQFKNSTLVEGGMDLEQRQLLPLGVHVEGLSSLREGAGAGTAKMQIGRGVLVKPEGHYEFEKGAEPQVMSPNEGKVVLGGGQRETVVDAIPDPFAFEDLNDPPRPQQQQQQRRDQQDQQQGQREQQQQQQSWGGGAPDPITMNDGTTRWQRAPLVPSTLNNIVFTKVSPRAIPPISKFVRDVAKDRDTLLGKSNFTTFPPPFSRLPATAFFPSSSNSPLPVHDETIPPKSVAVENLPPSKENNLPTNALARRLFCFPSLRRSSCGSVGF